MPGALGDGDGGSAGGSMLSASGGEVREPLATQQGEAWQSSGDRKRKAKEMQDEGAEADVAGT